jgi:hypothetical protein
MDSDGQPTSASDAPEYSLIMNTSRHTFLNRRSAVDDLANFTVLPWNQVGNHLIFIESSLGKSYYALDPEHASYYQLEPDYFFRKRTMAGFGRRAVFQAINPTPGTRMVIEISSSLKGDGENRLPAAAAVGRERAPFNVVGRGSARLISPPLEAQEIHGRRFLGLDMGVDGVPFKHVRTGLMRLYGSGLPDDSRRLTCFARDVSLISARDYDTLDAPAALDTFPDGLANRNLEYSGVYEDGWLSEHSSFVLSAPQGDKTTFVLRGEIPLIKDATFTTSCKLLIDGTPVVEQPLGLGAFVIGAPATPGRHQVELLFSRAQSLSGSDGRPVTARVRELGFRAR